MRSLAVVVTVVLTTAAARTVMAASAPPPTSSFAYSEGSRNPASSLGSQNKDTIGAVYRKTRQLQPLFKNRSFSAVPDFQRSPPILARRSASTVDHATASAAKGRSVVDRHQHAGSSYPGANSTGAKNLSHYGDDAMPRSARHSGNLLNVDTVTTLPVGDPCTDDAGQPRRCIPEYENVAFRRPVRASSTCGRASAARLCQVTPSGQMTATAGLHAAAWRTAPAQANPGDAGDASNGVSPASLTTLAVIDGDDDDVTDETTTSNSIDSENGAGEAAENDFIEELVRTCETCDSTSANARHPASLLTDVNNPSRPTCWMSEPFEPDSPGERNVSLQLSLGKRFELTYVSLQFCGASKPDSLAIYKSSDYGASWQPFQFYSTDCRGTYGMPTSSPASITAGRQHEPLCSDPNGEMNARTPNQITFSTLEGRPAAYQFDHSILLQEWVTATDIRIEFRRLFDPRQQQILLQPASDHQPAAHDKRSVEQGNNSTSAAVKNAVVADGGGSGDSSSSSSSANRLPAVANERGRQRRQQRILDDSHSLSASGSSSLAADTAAVTDSAELDSQPQQQQQQPRQQRSPTLPADPALPESSYHFYAMADLAVGGRCKCNGHAARCVVDEDDDAAAVGSPSIRRPSGNVPALRCECRHHTAGRDCERCAPFYFDRPWARATADNANECKPCQCHDHSSECRFSMDQYRRSEFRSGGVCINCRHNTAGVNCHLCREGYYRDPKLPITHPRTCKACRCNTAGSLHTNCDPVTGQCPCLQGVTGRECSRCLSGYLFRRELGGCIRAPVKRRLNEFGSMAADSPKLRVTVEDPDNGDYPSQHADEGGVVETHGRRRRPHYAEQCDPCKKGTKKMSFSKFCRKGYAVSVTLTDRERFGHWLRYTIELREVFKAGGERAQPGTISSLWVPRDDLRCRCPTLRLRRSYIVMGSNQMHAGKMSMTADRHSVVVDATAANLRHARGYRDQVEHCSDDR